MSGQMNERQRLASSAQESQAVRTVGETPDDFQDISQDRHADIRLLMANLLILQVPHQEVLVLVPQLLQLLPRAGIRSISVSSQLTSISPHGLSAPPPVILAASLHVKRS